MEPTYITITLPASAELRMNDLMAEINSLGHRMGISYKILAYDDRWEELGVGEYVSYRTSLSDLTYVMRKISESLPAQEVTNSEYQLSLF